MKSIKMLFSVRFAALVLVACTVFTGMMYRLKCAELREARDEIRAREAINRKATAIRREQAEDKENMRLMLHADWETLKIQHRVIREMQHRLDKYEPGEPEHPDMLPQGAGIRLTGPNSLYGPKR